MSQYLLGDRFLCSLLEFIEAGRHKLHAYPHICFRDKAAKALHNVRAVLRLKYHIQIHGYSFCLLVVASPSHLLFFGGERIFERLIDLQENNLRSASMIVHKMKFLNPGKLTFTAIIAPLGLCLILTTCPLVPFPNSLRYSKS